MLVTVVQKAKATQPVLVCEGHQLLLSGVLFYRDSFALTIGPKSRSALILPSRKRHFLDPISHGIDIFSKC